MAQPELFFATRGHEPESDWSQEKLFSQQRQESKAFIKVLKWSS